MATNSGDRFTAAQRAHYSKGKPQAAKDQRPAPAPVAAKVASNSWGVERTVLLGAATGLLAWLPIVALDYVGMLSSPTEPARSAVASETPIVATDDAIETNVSASPSRVTQSAASGNTALPDDPTALSATFIERQIDNRTTAVASSMVDPAATTEFSDAPVERRLPHRNPRQHAASAASTSLDKQAVTPKLSQPRQSGMPHSVVRVADAGKDSADSVAKVGFIEAEAAAKKAAVSVANYESNDAPLEATVETPQTDETTTISLMHDLHAADAATARNALQQLQTRGFTENHIELARRLTSPQAETRAGLARELPATSGIDSRLWLTWLLRDEDASVRLSALSVLATASDPATLHRVVAIARQDRSADIRKLGESLEKSLR